MLQQLQPPQPQPTDLRLGPTVSVVEPHKLVRMGMAGELQGGRGVVVVVRAVGQAHLGELLHGHTHHLASTFIPTPTTSSSTTHTCSSIPGAVYPRHLRAFGMRVRAGGAVAADGVEVLREGMVGAEVAVQQLLVVQPILRPHLRGRGAALAICIQTLVRESG